MKGKQFSNLARRTTLIILDLANGGERTAHARGKQLLREIEFFTSGFDPLTKSICIHSAGLYQGCVIFCVTHCHLFGMYDAYHVVIERRYV